MNGRRWGSAAILMLGVTAVLVGGPRAARGGVAAGATYVGSTVCMGCHRGMHAAAVAGWQSSAHASAMWSVAEPGAGCQILGDFGSSPPFAKDQIAYVLGVGTRSQAYLDKGLKVLPGEWDVKAKAWKPREAVDGKTQCIGCHVTGFTATDNTWKALGVGCEMCHGPGSAHIGSSDKKGTIVSPMSLDPQKRTMVCAQCHSRGKSKDNVHAFPIGFRPGDDLDPLFTYDQNVPPGAMNSQYNEMRFGGGKHLAAGAVCLTCHDPHGGQGATMLRQTPPDLCTQCHKNLTGPQHSAETLKSVSCTMCHMPKNSHAFVRPHAG